MVDQATAKYLNDNIGPLLSKALSEMVVQQPNDGVDFIAQWLKTYVEQEEMKAVREKEEKQLLEDRAITQKNEAEKAKRTEQKLKEKGVVEDSYKGLLSTFNDKETIFKEEYWSELVNVAKQYMGAESVYLGLLDEEGLQDVEPPLIRYSHENVRAGSPTLLDKVLIKMNGEVENLTFAAVTESIPEEEHQQRYLWKPPMPPLPPAEDGEEPVVPPGPKYLPVSIPCVTDVSSVHYFEMPRLGAYLAVPLVYSSYYTQEAFDQARKFEEEKAEDLRKKEEADREKEDKIREATEKGEQPPEFPEEEPVPEKVMELTGSTVRMVLCLDTLGANKLFSESAFVDLMALCDACAECKARTETKQVDEQALFSIEQQQIVPDEEGETPLSRLWAEVELEVSKSLEDELKAIAEAQPPYEPEIKKTLEENVQKKFSFMKAKTVVGLCRDQILKFVSTSYAVPQEVLNVFAAIAFLIGCTKEEVYPPRKNVMKWWRMRSMFEGVIAEEFFTKVEACTVSVGRKNLTAEQKLTFIQSLMPADYTSEKAIAVDPYFDVLWTFLSAALEHRTAELKQTQSDIEARKKEAEAAEQPFDEPVLTTIDDDFEGFGAAA